MQHPVRLALVLALATACGKVEATTDGGVEPDASEFTDGGSGVDGAVDDTTPPETTIESAPPNPSASRTASFGFSASEPGCTFRCQLDGAALLDCDADHVIEVDSDGAHDLEVRAVDPAGNQDETPARHAWTVDTRDPVVTVSSGPSTPTSATDAAFEFTADEQATFECRRDGGSWQPCTDTAAYAGVADGNHLFEARATDLAGNQGIGTWAWTVDADAPSIEILTHPANPTSSTSAAFSFAAESGATVACRMDAGGFGACTSPTTMTYPALSANTTHTFRVRATDAASNSAIATYAWTIDTQAPTVEILNTPADPTSATTAAFTFSVNEAGTIECRLDGAGFGPCTSSTTMNYPSVAANTSHTFRVRATDEANNSATAQYTWTVDTTPPDTLLDAVPSDPYPVDWADFAFHSDDAVATYQCNLDGFGWGGCSSPLHWTKLGYGAHTLQVRGIDALGNVEPSPAAYTWKAEPGLILHFPFDASLKNASPLGARFDGDGFGFDYTSGPKNQAILFAQGEVKVAQTAELLSSDIDYTIGMWVAEVVPQTDPVYRHLFNTQAAQGGLAAFRYNSKDYELWGTFAGHTGVTGGTKHNFYLGQGWRHIIYEYDSTPGKGGSIVIYVNGASAATIANPTQAVIFSEKQLESLLIGSNSRFIIDDLRVYNRVYSMQEKCEQIIGGLWVAAAAPYCKM